MTRRGGSDSRTLYAMGLCVADWALTTLRAGRLAETLDACVDRSAEKAAAPLVILRDPAAFLGADVVASPAPPVCRGSTCDASVSPVVICQAPQRRSSGRTL
jgi:hypothetical protein